MSKKDMYKETIFMVEIPVKQLEYYNNIEKLNNEYFSRLMKAYDKIDELLEFKMNTITDCK